jgi:hypothetical protein
MVCRSRLQKSAATKVPRLLPVAHHEPYGHMTPAQRTLRNKLRARARQIGDTQDAKGQLSVYHLAQECAYEHWHRMLFARFLAENNTDFSLRLHYFEDAGKTGACRSDTA